MAGKFICLIALVWMASCKKEQANSYTRDPKGFYYKLLAIGDGTVKSAADSILICDVTLSTGSDSIFFNSTGYSVQGFCVKLLSQNRSASGKYYLESLAEGDSVSLMVRKDCFFREYFDTIAPVFCVPDSLVKVNIKIREFLTKDEYSHYHPDAAKTDDQELKELKLIDDYLKQVYPGVEANAEGLYILEHQKTNGEKVSVGRIIRISYSGFNLNGKSIDNGSQQLEFAYGSPDQLVKGLNIVIENLKKGETTKIIVPSRLAFGESGSSNSSIPPYTPLVYNIKLIDIK